MSSSKTISEGWRLAIALVSASVAVVVAVVIAVRWLEHRDAVARALPLHSGRIAVAGAGGEIGIVRDARGIPHVFATADRDAWLGLGFAHAQDRLAQMLWLRRLARGRSAEWVGERALAADRWARTVGFGRLGDAAFEALGPEPRAALEAYAAGVNARIGRIERGEVGRPVGLLGRPGAPEPWTPGDSLAVFKLVSWATGATPETGIVLSELITRLGGVGSRPFFPAGGSSQAVTLPLEPVPDARRPTDPDHAGDFPGLPPVGSDRGPGDPLPLAAARLDGSAWVLPGSATASGGAILGAEITLATTAPALLHQARLRAGGLDVVGAAVPGVPLLWAGRNADVAWASNPARAASTDLFVETVRSGDRVRYHDGGRWRDVEERVEEIRVGAGEEARVETWTVRSTSRGPLIDDLLPRGDERLSLAWTGARSGPGFESLWQLARARSANDVRTALRPHVDPLVVVVFADRSGARGSQLAGWLPQRVLPTSLVPVPGRMRAFRWQRAIDFDDLPAERRGADEAGWVLASDEVHPEQFGPRRIEWLWRSGVRANRLGALLDARIARGGVDPAQAAGLLGDRAAAGAAIVIAAAFTLVDAEEGAAPLPPNAQEVRRLLEDWDGELAPQSSAALAYGVWLDELVSGLFADRLGPGLLARYAALPLARPSRVAAEILRAAARGGTPGAWADAERVRRLVRKSLQRTSLRLRARLGPNRSRWGLGRVHRVAFVPFEGFGAGAVPVLGAFPIGGGPEAVRLTEGRVLAPLRSPGNGARDAAAESLGEGAGTARPAFEPVRRASSFWLVADLGVGLEARDAVWSSLAPGQDEHPDARHHADGVVPWLERRALPIALLSALDDDAGVARLVLVPAP